MMHKWFLSFFIVFLLASCSMSETYEEPPFTVVKKDGAVEWREYAPYLVAEVIATGERDAAANEAFRSLFDYISGGNAPKENMAMTVPVTQQQKKDGWAVHFVMPLSKTMGTLPKPDDSRITLRKEAQGKILAIVFSGTSSKSNLDEHEQKLRAYAAKNGISIKNPPIYAFYNSPFSLPFMRRNEILFVMDK